MQKRRAEEILRKLQDNFSIPSWASSNRDPFRTLILTVLSQATTDKNSARAFRNLQRRSSITPETLFKAEITDIESAIKVGGLYRNKARVIKAISRMILEQHEGSLDFIYSLPFEDARKILLALPGVGPKTADILLLFCARKPAIPVDTHVNRVSKRLALVPAKADYEGVRRVLESLYSSEDYLNVHLMFISHGRKFCKARKPLCKICPVNALCPSRRTED
ncbi:MAG: endonuclease III [Candidatus Bathyarchaeum sp.]|nr:MAG: endonuclease III [Candidatus Bathyarchaeum sp.]